MSVFRFLAENINLGVDSLRRMDANLDFAGRDVVNEADHAFFHDAIVSRLLNALFQFVEKLGTSNGRVGSELKPLIPSFLNQSVDVDADENPNPAGTLNKRSDAKVARCAEVAYQDIEEMDVLVRKDARNLLQHGATLFIGEELCGHDGRRKIGEGEG
ncbi:MAG: hypothetical protein Q7S40_14360 [Opitutaceae bacterium]|nr:hypothetical protein [Opitutaceae bacterium]